MMDPARLIYVDYNVKVKGHDLGHYPAILLKRSSPHKMFSLSLYRPIKSETYSLVLEYLFSTYLVDTITLSDRQLHLMLKSSFYTKLVFKCIECMKLSLIDSNHTPLKNIATSDCGLTKKMGWKTFIILAPSWSWDGLVH